MSPTQMTSATFDRNPRIASAPPFAITQVAMRAPTIRPMSWAGSTQAAMTPLARSSRWKICS
jgi:hypothetical protein